MSFILRPINPHYVYYTIDAIEWAIRLIMLAYVPQRRTTAAARSWLLLIFLLPIPGCPRPDGTQSTAG